MTKKMCKVSWELERRIKGNDATVSCLFAVFPQSPNE